MNLIDKHQYDPATIEKVERLFCLLESFYKHPFLNGNFALFGGTAINLLMLDIPRLSVDIDIAMVGFENLDDLNEARPKFENSIMDIARFEGYDVRPGVVGHAGRTITLNYSGRYGRDKIKIDCIYMNRVPLLVPVVASPKIIPGLDIPVFQNEELIGGKVKAFFDRVKIRDIYDLYNISKYYHNECPKNLHKLILFYSCVSSTFPFSFEDRTKKFLDLDSKINDDLFPMIKLGDYLPDLKELIETANDFISLFVKPVDEFEQRFVDEFASGNFFPELLFEEKSIVDRARRSPVAK